MSGAAILPSLGERLRVGELRSGMRLGVGILSFCSSVRYKGVGIYLPSLGEGPGVGVRGGYLPSLGVIDEVASLVEE